MGGNTKRGRGQILREGGGQKCVLEYPLQYLVDASFLHFLFTNDALTCIWKRCIFSWSFWVHLQNIWTWGEETANLRMSSLVNHSKFKTSARIWGKSWRKRIKWISTWSFVHLLFVVPSPLYPSWKMRITKAVFEISKHPPLPSNR